MAGGVDLGIGRGGGGGLIHSQSNFGATKDT